MAEQNWREVLREIYNNDEYWNMASSNLSKLAEEVGISEEELDSVLKKLESQSLIKRDLDNVTLTQRGFDHIKSIELHNEQLMTDRILLVFTTVLTVGIVSISSIALSFVDNPVMSISLYALYAIVFLVLGALLSEKFGI